MAPVVTVVVIFVVIVLVVGVSLMWLRRMARAREAALRERFPLARLVQRGANFLGQESKGPAQMRGNGTLVLTDGEIIFERWLPRAEFRIRAADIVAVETVTGFLGKTVGRPLLRVVYTPVTGQTDSMAWWVRDIDSVIVEIERVRATFAQT